MLVSWPIVETAGASLQTTEHDFSRGVNPRTVHGNVANQHGGFRSSSHLAPSSLVSIGVKPADMTDDKWNEVDGNAIANLHLALADGVLSSVAEKKTSKEIWDTLTKLYEAKSMHNKIFLKRRLYTLRMAESTTVTDHINTLNTMFSQLTTLSHTIQEAERAELLLQSLPDSYDQLVINLTNNLVPDQLIFDNVAASVLEEESRRKNKEDQHVSSHQAEALSVTRGRSMERGPSGSHNKGRSKSRHLKNIKCFGCGKKGHLKRDCWNKKKGGEHEKSNAQSCVASASDDGEVLYGEVSTQAEGRKAYSDVWLLDSGATWHMTPRREWFHKYECIPGGSVYMGNDQALEIAGVGTIKIKMFDGTVRTIQDVRHVRGLKKNLLSLGQLDDLGCKSRIENGILKVIKGVLVVMKAEKVGSNLTRNENVQSAEIQVDWIDKEKDSSEETPEPSNDDPNEIEETQVQRPSRERKLPAWLSDYETESNKRKLTWMAELERLCEDMISSSLQVGDC
ncbi:hypothetical protein SASPL_121096 [Salvia splendens]|uniref:CCHC-type domain-containing protein n=1 Tax=Salvia splendens TaxID=180675 RepID=A0A8X8XQU9_SALSN|nr:hypothetical protein SASPL_121096 [Salvia splendens]